MPTTLPDYAAVKHEIARADFFGTVPQYKANLQIELDRMDIEVPGLASNPGLAVAITNHHNSNKYGVKRGSPFTETG